MEVSNPERVVYPVVARTKADVVRYYERVAPRALGHLLERPLSIRRFPKGLAAPGFFQKNVPAHYPASIARFAVPRSKAAAKKHRRRDETSDEVTVYPILQSPDHLAYLANQGAIELHVPCARAQDLHRPDRVVIDLDPPEGAIDLVREAARRTRVVLAELGLTTTPVATGSKGYHVVAAIRPTVDFATIATSLHKLAILLAARHPDVLTDAFRVKERGARVFVDWLRNQPGATVVAPYSLRARPRATVAAPLDWDELGVLGPDAFTIDDVDRLLERPDSIEELARSPCDAEPFIEAVDAAFAGEGLVLRPFDRFRS
jgi:bifunctional non-homologous end joining protein LigD